MFRMSRAPQSSLSASGWKTFAGYGAMIVAAVGAFLWIRSSGESLIAPPPTPGVTFGQARHAGHFDILLHVLLVLVVVILASRALGALFRYFHQPPVIGEVIAGIMLGPSLLGRIAPGASAYLLPPEIGPTSRCWRRSASSSSCSWWASSSIQVS
jgi:hypothetical protein